MAKLKHTFVRGRMNKDIDERLVPNGEYRDALNIQVSTSEGSDVGAIENILGNTKKNLKSLSPDVFWDNGFGFQNIVCIGGTRDAQNDKIYWFITSDDGDAIIEYDKVTDLVTPVLVDLQNVLNFSKTNLITGVNIIDGLLFWTDGATEPKVINIDRFKTGSNQGVLTNFGVHTEVYDRDFVLSDVTVMAKVPGEKLTATPFASLVGGPGTGITPIVTNSFSGFFDAQPGDVITVGWTNSGSNITWPANSRAVFTTEIEQTDGTVDKYQVIGEFTSLVPGAVGGSLTVESATPNIPGSYLEWEMLLIEDDPIFKDEFPRFSYRYKYADNRYSVFAPFTNPVFIAGKFEYLSRDGNNEGMESVMRKITLSNFPTIPADVKEIEVLYKGARSNNVYIIETFQHDPTLPFQPVLTLDITSDVLGPVISSEQLLRLYDNVPRTAKAQEIIANRLIYGNYLQNYDVSAGSVRVTANTAKSAHSNVGFGIESVKTNRTYQVGVTFLDDFGRESPVFTTNVAAVTFNKEDASSVNSIEALLPSNTSALAANGGWASAFKFYIKDQAPEYYNIALDRYYDAEDGGIWLSFPSAERNKLQVGKYITLKKQHDSSIPVTINNKYKVLDISNETPEFLAFENKVKARTGILANMSTGLKGFTTGLSTVKFWGPVESSNLAFFSGFANDSYVEFTNEDNVEFSNLYKVLEGGPTGVEEDITIGANTVTYALYELILEEVLKLEDQWLADLNDQSLLKATIYQKERQALPEFQGRFFAKIEGNATFTDNVAKAFNLNAPKFSPQTYFDVYPDGSILTTGGGTKDHAIMLFDDDASDTSYVPLLPSLGSNLFRLAFAILDATFQDSKEYYDFTTGSRNGLYLKFEYTNGSFSDSPYEIVSKTFITQGYNRVSTTTGRLIEYQLDRDFDDSNYNPSDGVSQFAKIWIYKKSKYSDADTISSTNPAIFETEPDELADLDIYWEASEVIPEAQAGNTITLDWFNCYSFGNGVESDRIRDDYNATLMGKGVRVSSVLKEPYEQENRTAGLIYSGIYNNISGVNETNQFIQALKITKDLDPVYGSIQKLFSRDTNLLAFCEDKVYAILADKDALYNADGNVNLTSTNRVLGNANTFAGEFGISKNPESFAQYGFRIYFTDKARSAVLRLSGDGITEISEKGMTDYFQDGFAINTTPVIGSYDESTSSYNLKFNNETVAFKERVDGWTTRLSFEPEFALSLNNEYYTFKDGEIWEHSNEVRNNFYNTQYESSVTTVFNDSPSTIKNFKTLAYEGSEKWSAVVETENQKGYVPNWRTNEGLYFNYIKGDAVTWDNIAQTGNIDAKQFSVQGLGSITIPTPGTPYTVELGGNANVSLSIGDSFFIKRGTDILQVGDVTSVVGNRVQFNDLSNINPNVGEFAFFLKSNSINTSGVIGYHANITLTNASTAKTELFAVSSEVFISSQ